MVKHICSLWLLILSVITVSAQVETNFQSRYDPTALFAPNFYPTGNSITRSATGEPNVGYWQNRADYRIQATLDDITNRITGTVTITYKNNSPHRFKKAIRII